MNRRNLGTTVSGTLSEEDKRWVDNNEMYTQSEIVRMGVQLLRKTLTESKSDDFLPKIDSYHKDRIFGKSLVKAYSETLITKDDLRHIKDSYLELINDLQEALHLLDD